MSAAESISVGGKRHPETKSNMFLVAHVTYDWCMCVGTVSRQAEVVSACGCVCVSLQGSGQEKAGSNWGDGFVTDKAVLKERQMSDPNAFFTALLSKPYRNSVVLSPHLYGPSLSNNTYNIGEPQWKTYSASW